MFVFIVFVPCLVLHHVCNGWDEFQEYRVDDARIHVHMASCDSWKTLDSIVKGSYGALVAKRIPTCDAVAITCCEGKCITSKRSESLIQTT